MQTFRIQQPYPVETDGNIQEKREHLSEQLDECKGVKSQYRKHLKSFLEEMRIWDITQMDFPLRQIYKEYVLESNPSGEYYEYVTAFDRIKQHSIREQTKTLAGRITCQWKYENKCLFIPYHHDPDIVAEFERLRYSEKAVWDFSINCSVKLKHQIFAILNCVIDECKARINRGYKLSALKELYAFCVESNIEDIETLENEQIATYKEYLSEKGYSFISIKNMIPLLSLGRKALFLQAGPIHWYANVWYLDRFQFSKNRVDPSQIPQKVSFLNIEYRKNRQYAKEYMKYQLGIGELAVSTLIEKYCEIQNFLMALDKQKIDACYCPIEIIDEYFNTLRIGRAASAYNSNISAVWEFYKFFEVKGVIDKVPFYKEYYKQKEIPAHYDRSVDIEVSLEIIKELKNCPEHIRVMYLHMWCLGLRISEICTLKSDAYYLQGDDAWIQVYQVKMKNYKRVPIPRALYDIMQVYITKNEIKSGEYLFKNKKGGAFSKITLCTQMKKYFNQIGGFDYSFQSHDYRHSVATMFYDNDVSLQSIRDYLGHTYEEMTEQYIDYMPQKIAKANDEYFKTSGNNLAAMMKGGTDEK